MNINTSYIYIYLVSLFNEHKNNKITSIYKKIIHMMITKKKYLNTYKSKLKQGIDNHARNFGIRNELNEFMIRKNV